jgi:hypothetical protein
MRRANLFGPDFSLLERLEAAGIDDELTLGELINGNRHVARDRLAIATIDETGRVLSALDRARKELGKEAALGSGLTHDGP